MHTNTQNIRFPLINPLLIEEAIKKNLITPHDKQNLILNANNNSIFFANFNPDSPTT
jgi:hypothetical protein